MPRTDPAELGRRMHAAFNARDFDAVQEIFAPDFHSHPLDAGRDAVPTAWESMAAMFPRAAATMLEMFRVADGRIAELWGAKGIPAGSA